MHRLLSGPLSVETLTIEVEGLPAALSGLKLVQLSDLHFDGQSLSEALLADAIARTHAIAPDIVVLTGDYVTDEPLPIRELAVHLSQLQSRLGTYAVLGNHDIYPSGAKDIIITALQQAGIHPLWNEIVYPFGPEFPVVGLAEYWSREFNPALVMDQLDPQQPRLVLSHNPDTAEHLRQWRVDLQLSGHTHGGQVVIPGLGPVPTWAQAIRPKIPRWLRRRIPYMSGDCVRVVRHWEWSHGLHDIGSNRLYVNRGLGTYIPPGRFFCRPELTVITLVSRSGNLQSAQGDAQIQASLSAIAPGRS